MFAEEGRGAEKFRLRAGVLALPSRRCAFDEFSFVSDDRRTSRTFG